MKKGSRLKVCRFGHAAWTTVAGGKRRCRICHAARQKRWRAAQRGVKPVGSDAGYAAVVARRAAARQSG